MTTTALTGDYENQKPPGLSVLVQLVFKLHRLVSNSTVQAAVTNRKTVQYAQTDLLHRPYAFYFARITGSWPDLVRCF